MLGRILRAENMMYGIGAKAPNELAGIRAALDTPTFTNDAVKRLSPPPPKAGEVARGKAA